MFSEAIMFLIQQQCRTERFIWMSGEREKNVMLQMSVSHCLNPKKICAIA